MFTGIVEEVGAVEAIESGDAGARLAIAAGFGGRAARGRLGRGRGRLPHGDGRPCRWLRRRRDEPDAQPDHARRARARRAGQPRAGAARRRAARRAHRAGTRRRRGRGALRGRGRLRPPRARRRPATASSATSSSAARWPSAASASPSPSSATDWFEVSLIPETLERTTLGAAAEGDARQPRARRGRPLRRAASTLQGGPMADHTTATAGALRHHRGGDRRDPPRAHGRRLRRRESRERGRSDDGRPVRDPRGDQLHGQGGARPDLPRRSPPSAATSSGST